MRADYAADKREIDREHAAREALCPVATALRDEIAQASGDGWAYAACCDAISSQVDLTPVQALSVRTMANLSRQAAQSVPRCISCGDPISSHVATGDEQDGRCTVTGCPCTCSPSSPEYFEVTK